MSTRLGTLGFLCFETAHLIDKGYNESIDDAHRLGIDDNGLGLIATNVVALFTNQTFRELDTGTEIEPNELTVVEDW